MSTIADIRKDYMLKSFLEADAKADAIEQFSDWWQDAINSEIEEVNALTLCTATADGKPSGRIVLLKGYDADGFVFFTNYNSNKGKELEANPQACLVFFWKELERQVRIDGTIQKISAVENDDYFFSRPFGSQVGAWASPQSTIIENREIIEKNVEKYQKEFAVNPISRPTHWGGYRVTPKSIEFWQGRQNRLHDRLQYTLQENRQWKIERLAP
jgi:pyridoxamine 5'-phosphate oxidase